MIPPMWRPVCVKSAGLPLGELQAAGIISVSALTPQDLLSRNRCDASAPCYQLPVHPKSPWLARYDEVHFVLCMTGDFGIIALQLGAGRWMILIPERARILLAIEAFGSRSMITK